MLVMNWVRQNFQCFWHTHIMPAVWTVMRHWIYLNSNFHFNSGNLFNVMFCSSFLCIHSWFLRLPFFFFILYLCPLLPYYHVGGFSVLSLLLLCWFASMIYYLKTWCSCLQIARAFGASEIIAVDVQDEKLQKAKMFGATHCVNALKEDAVKRIKV